MTRIPPIIAVLLVALFAMGFAGCRKPAQTDPPAGGPSETSQVRQIEPKDPEENPVAPVAVPAIEPKDAEGMLIGAAVGAGAGYIVGNEADKTKLKDEIENNPQMVNTLVVNVRNRDGSFTPVTMRRAGDFWIGPNGEQYSAIPTEDQLRALYGR